MDILQLREQLSERQRHDAERSKIYEQTKLLAAQQANTIQRLENEIS